MTADQTRHVSLAAAARYVDFLRGELAVLPRSHRLHGEYREQLADLVARGA